MNDTARNSTYVAVTIAGTILNSTSMMDDTMTTAAANKTAITSDPSAQYKLIASSTVAIIGTLLNSLSLSYYIISLRHQNKKGLTRLVIFLNIFDLAVCLCAALVQVFYQGHKHFRTDAPPNLGKFLEISFLSSMTLYRIATLTTGVVTCILSFTRALSLCRPFYRPKIRIVVGVLVATVIVQTVPNFAVLVIFYTVETLQTKMAVYSKVTLKLEMVVLLLLVTLVAGVNFMTVFKMWAKVRNPLTSRCRDKSKDTDFIHATVTVTILSGIFCLLNLFYLAVLFGPCVTSSLQHATCSPETLIQWFAMWQALPINSTLNPLVYFARSESMRHYLKYRLFSLFSCCYDNPHTNPWLEHSRLYSLHRPCGGMGYSSDLAQRMKKIRAARAAISFTKSLSDPRSEQV